MAPRMEVRADDDGEIQIVAEARTLAEARFAGGQVIKALRVEGKRVYDPKVWCCPDDAVARFECGLTVL